MIDILPVAETKNKKITTVSLLYGWVVCSLAALFYCYEYLLRIEPSLMVPQLMAYFHITAAGIGVLSAMYYYAYAPLQVFIGMLIDAFGPRSTLIGAILLCVIGAFFFALTKNLYVALLGRFLIGAGSAFAFVGVLKLAAMWLPNRRFALFVGLTAVLGMVGAVLGDVELSWAVNMLGWHNVVLISAIIGAALIPVFMIFVRDTISIHDMEHRYLDLKQLGFELIDIFKNKQIIYAGLIGSLLFISMSVFAEMWGIPFVQSIVQKTKYGAELNAIVFLGWLMGAPLNGWLSDKVQSRRLPLIVGGIGAALSFSVILIWPQKQAIFLASFLFLFGFFASAEIICFAIVRDCVTINVMATALSVVNVLITVGGMILQPLVGWLLDVDWAGKMWHGIRFYPLIDYRYALIIVPVAMLLATLCAIVMKESYQK